MASSFCKICSKAARTLWRINNVDKRGLATGLLQHPWLQIYLPLVGLNLSRVADSKHHKRGHTC